MSIKVSIEIKKSNKISKVWVRCPSCNRADWYYTLGIDTCDLCGAAFGDINGISSNLNKRLEYHTTA